MSSLRNCYISTLRNHALTFALPRWIVVACLLVGLGTEAGRAQPTNLEAFQQLAWRCLDDAPDTLTAFRLDAPATMPYLRSSLVQRWQEQDRTLYTADSAAAPPHPRLAYAVDEATVHYEAVPDDRIQRTLMLALQYTISTTDGQLLSDQRCEHSYADTVARAAVPDLEAAAHPRTQGTLPPSGSWRQYLKPALLIGATAVTVYLLFAVRSSGRTESAR